MAAAQAAQAEAAPPIGHPELDVEPVRLQQPFSVMSHERRRTVHVHRRREPRRPAEEEERSVPPLWLSECWLLDEHGAKLAMGRFASASCRATAVAAVNEVDAVSRPQSPARAGARRLGCRASRRPPRTAACVAGCRAGCARDCRPGERADPAARKRPPRHHRDMSREYTPPLDVTLQELRSAFFPATARLKPAGGQSTLAVARRRRYR